MKSLVCLVNICLLNHLVCCQNGDPVSLSEWLDRVSNFEEVRPVPFGGMAGAKKINNPLLRNVDCGGDTSSTTDNFYFENGRFDAEGRFSGPGTLYIFDRLEGAFRL